MESSESEIINATMQNPYTPNTPEWEAWRKGASGALWAVSVAMGQTDYADNTLRDVETWIGLYDPEEN